MLPVELVADELPPCYCDGITRSWEIRGMSTSFDRIICTIRCLGCGTTSEYVSAYGFQAVLTPVALLTCLNDDDRLYLAFELLPQWRSYDQRREAGTKRNGGVCPTAYLLPPEPENVPDDLAIAMVTARTPEQIIWERPLKDNEPWSPHEVPRAQLSWDGPPSEPEATN